jgi:putative restriction endonuclease
MHQGDDDVRAAALARVQQLHDRHGARIPLSALKEGVVIQGNRVPLWNPRKGIHKPAVLGSAGAALTIFTSCDSPYEDVHDADAGVITYKYQGRDPDSPDNRSVRRAWETRAPLIYLIGVDPGVYDVIAPVYVVGDDPNQLEFTLAVDQMAAVGEWSDSVEAVVRREYVTRAVLQRLHQGRFRRLVLHAYREQCGICRLRHVELLDAAHILGDRHPKGEPIVTNGIGLCKIHHSAFDADIIGIDPDARVHVREDILHEKDGPMLRHGLQGVANTKLILPRKIELRPNPDFLAERFDQFLAA